MDKITLFFTDFTNHFVEHLPEYNTSTIISFIGNVKDQLLVNAKQVFANINTFRYDDSFIDRLLNNTKELLSLPKINVYDKWDQIREIISRNPVLTITIICFPVFVWLLINCCRGGKGGRKDWSSSNVSNASIRNRANQMNPNHKSSGPGRFAGYTGSGTSADLNNRAKQLNPNNRLFQGGSRR